MSTRTRQGKRKAKDEAEAIDKAEEENAEETDETVPDPEPKKGRKKKAEPIEAKVEPVKIIRRFGTDEVAFGSWIDMSKRGKHGLVARASEDVDKPFPESLTAPNISETTENITKQLQEALSEAEVPKVAVKPVTTLQDTGVVESIGLYFGVPLKDKADEKEASAMKHDRKTFWPQKYYWDGSRIDSKKLAKGQSKKIPGALLCVSYSDGSEEHHYHGK